MRGRNAWDKDGVIFSKMNRLPSSVYCGAFFDDNTYTIVPRDVGHAPAVYAFVRSKQFRNRLRAINQKLNVTRGLVSKIPFDLDHWKQVAAKQYPHGLSEPYSDDPTQWDLPRRPVPECHLG